MNSWILPRLRGSQLILSCNMGQRTLFVLKLDLIGFSCPLLPKESWLITLIVGTENFNQQIQLLSQSWPRQAGGGQRALPSRGSGICLVVLAGLVTWVSSPLYLDICLVPEAALVSLVCSTEIQASASTPVPCISVLGSCWEYSLALNSNFLVGA